MIESDATVIVSEHDLDVIRNADYIIDMGLGDGAQGGRIIAAGTPEEIGRNSASVTGNTCGGEVFPVFRQHLSARLFPTTAVGSLHFTMGLFTHKQPRTAMCGAAVYSLRQSAYW